MKTCAEVLNESGSRYERYRYYYPGHLWSLVSNVLESIRVNKVLENNGIPLPKTYFGYLVFSSSKSWREEQIRVWKETTEGCSAEWSSKNHVWDVRKLVTS